MPIFSNSLDALSSLSEVTYFQHPDYVYYKPDWQLLRDSVAGERRIKEKGSLYLSPIDSDANPDGASKYRAFVERAVYTNMTARTLAGLVGKVFKRPVKIKNIKDSTRELFNNVTIDGWSANLFAKAVVKEILEVGRVGIMVDMPEGGGSPYFTYYLAENILNWKEIVVNGRRKIVYVLLREIVESTLEYTGVNSRIDPKTHTSYRFLKSQYRVLRLNEFGEYIQEVYKSLPSTNSGYNQKLDFVKSLTPTKNGKPLDYIPFVIIGPQSVSPGIQKSPLLDIANLNIAHYRTSAHLEHGRFYTALPVYYVPVNQSQPDAETEYTVGPGRVWEVPLDTKPGILEFYGTGLASLVKSLEEKSSAIERLGGSLTGGAGASQSAEVHSAQQSGETSILLNVTDSATSGLTRATRYLLDWAGLESEAKEVLFEINQEFKLGNLDARELRSIALLYKEGILPISDVHRVLQQSSYVNENVDVKAFKKMLADITEFPNQPNAEAKTEGYNTADAMQADELAREEMDVIAEQNRRQMTFDREQLAADVAAADKAAKVADKTKSAGKTTPSNKNGISPIKAGDEKKKT